MIGKEYNDKERRFGIDRIDETQLDRTDPLKPTEKQTKYGLDKLGNLDIDPGVSKNIGSSKYDDGILVFEDPAKVRYENQPFIDALANSAARSVLDMGLTMVENAGYLLEVPTLFGENPDFTNALTEFATKNKERLRENLPAYLENPNQVFDVTDTRWWLNHGADLVSSVGSFLVTGAGVGSFLGKGASVAAKALGNAMTIKNIGTGIAQGLTSATLAYVEGAMSGSQVYKDVYDKYKYELGEEAAREKASQAASKTVLTNVKWNTLLNMTSVAPMFKTSKYMRKYVKEIGANRGKTELRNEYRKRLQGLLEQGAIKNKNLGVYLGEALQESTEEVVNVYAEKEGQILGGLIDAPDKKGLQYLLDVATSDEGKLSAFLGALGGVGQTLGMRNLPIHKVDQNGKTIRTGAANKDAILAKMRMAEHVGALKTDLTAIDNIHGELSNAVSKGDTQEIADAKQRLFDIASYNSIKNGIGEQLVNDFEEILNTDNEKIGEDGLTDAMRLGYADSKDDHHYKKQAARQIHQIKKLTDIYEDTTSRYDGDEAERNLGKRAFYYQVKLNSLRGLVEDQDNEKAKFEQRMRQNMSDRGTNLSAQEAALRDVEIQTLQQKINDYKKDKKSALIRANRHNIPGAKDIAVDIESRISELQNAIKQNKEAIKQEFEVYRATKDPEGLRKVSDLREEFDKARKANDEDKEQLSIRASKIAQDRQDLNDLQSAYDEFMQPATKRAFLKAERARLAKAAKKVEEQEAKQEEEQKLTGDEEANQRRATQEAQADPFGGVEMDEGLDAILKQDESGRLKSKSPAEVLGDGAEDTEGEVVQRPFVDTESGERRIMEISYDQNGNVIKSRILNEAGEEVSSKVPLDPFVDNRRKERAGKEGVGKEGDPTKPPVLKPKEIEEDIQAVINELRSLNVRLLKESAISIANLDRPYVQSKQGFAVGPAGNAINPDYNTAILSPDINVGDEVTLYVDTESEFYEANKNNPDLIPIAIKRTKDGQHVGYVHDTTYTSRRQRTAPGENDINLKEQTELVKRIRRVILKLGGNVNTTITNKTTGFIRTEQNFVRAPLRDRVGYRRLYLGKNGNLYLDRNNISSETLENEKFEIRDGYMYHVETAPNGTTMTMAVTPPKLKDTGMVKSIINAIKVFTNRLDLTEAQLQQLRDLDMDITTAKGLENYVNNFIFVYYQLSKDATQESIKKDTKSDRDKFYFNITDKSFQFQKNGGSISFIQKDKDIDYAKAFNRLENYLNNAYMNMNAAKLSDRDVTIPVLNMTETGLELGFSENYRDYSEFIGSYATTPLISEPLANGETVVFEQPTMQFGTEFVAKYEASERGSSKRPQMTKPAKINTKTSEKAGNSFYLSMPNSDGSFNESSSSKTNKPGASIYKFTKTGDNTAEFEIDQSEESVKLALQYPDKSIEPATDAQNAYDPKAVGITTIEPGRAVLENGKWVIKSKAKIRYEGAETLGAQQNKGLNTSRARKLDFSIADNYEETEGDNEVEKNKYPVYLVPGYTSEQQDAVVNMILYHITDGIKTGDWKTFKEGAKDLKTILTEDNEGASERIDKLLADFDKFSKVALLRGFSKGIFTYDGRPEVAEIQDISELYDEDAAATLGFEDVDAFERTNFNDNWSLKIDHKRTASGAVRQLLNFIADRTLNPDGTTTAKFHELTSYPKFFGYDQVYNDLNSLLADVPPRWEDMRAVLTAEENIARKPYLESVVRAIEKDKQDPERLKIQFVQAMSKTYARHYAVVWANTNKGYQAQILESNRNTLKAVIERDWRENLKNSNLVTSENDQHRLKKSLLGYEGELAVLYRSIQEAYKRSEDWKPMLKDWLELIGVRLSDATFENITEGKVKFGRSIRTIKEHLNSRRGVFYSMYRRLITPEESSDVPTPLFQNNPLTNNEGVEFLAQEEAKHSLEHLTNSWRNINGDLVYGYTLNREMTVKYRELINNPAYASKMYQYPSHSNTINPRTGEPIYKNWLYKLSQRADNPSLPNDGLFQSSFSLAMVDGIRKSSSFKSGKELSKMNDVDREIYQLALFQNGTKVGEETIAGFTRLIPDKSTAFVVNALKEDISVVIDNGAVKDINSSTLDALFGIAESEMRRIYDYQRSEKPGHSVDAYKKGGNKFWYFPTLNDLTFFNETTQQEEGIFVNGVLRERSEIDNAIRAEIKKVALKGIQLQLNKWDDLSLVKRTTDNVEVDFMSTAYLRGIKGIPEVTVANRVAYAAADYYINSMLANYNIQQMFTGDPSLFTKGDYDSTINNIFKRMQKDVAPRLDFVQMGKNETFIAIKARDKKKTSAVSRNIEQYRERLSASDAAKYADIESTDSAELVTIGEQVHIMYRSGKLSTKKYNDLLKRIDNNGDDLVLSDNELRLVFGATKPVYASEVFDDILMEEYIKSATIPLIPQFTKGLPIDKVRKAMQALENVKARRFARLSFRSANKVGGKNFVSIFDANGNIPDNLDFSNAVQDLPRKGMGIQQEMPYKAGQKEVVKGSQVSKLLITDALIGSEYENLRSRWIAEHDNLYRTSRLLVEQELADETGEIDVKKLQSRLLKEAYNRNMPINVILGLSLTKTNEGYNEFINSLWLSPYANKFESLIISVFDTIAKQKMPGRAYTLTTEEGWDGFSDGIVYTGNYDGKGLLPMRVEDEQQEDGTIKKVVKPAQIIVPWNFTNEDGTVLSIDKFTKIVNGKKMLDTTLIDKDLLKSFGFRIPTSGHNSMGYFEIAGFFPAGQDVVMAPKDFITQAGWDFDADKLYTYQYWTEWKDGKLQRYQTPESPEAFERKIDTSKLSIQEILERLYPEIKLNITNNPVWEQGRGIFNQQAFNNRLFEVSKTFNKVLNTNIVLDENQEEDYVVGGNTISISPQALDKKPTLLLTRIVKESLLQEDYKRFKGAEKDLHKLIYKIIDSKLSAHDIHTYNLTFIEKLKGYIDAIIDKLLKYINPNYSTRDRILLRHQIKNQTLEEFINNLYFNRFQLHNEVDVIPGDFGEIVEENESSESDLEVAIPDYFKNDIEELAAVIKEYNENDNITDKDIEKYIDFRYNELIDLGIDKEELGGVLYLLSDNDSYVLSEAMRNTIFAMQLFGGDVVYEETNLNVVNKEPTKKDKYKRSKSIGLVGKFRKSGLKVVHNVGSYTNTNKKDVVDFWASLKDGKIDIVSASVIKPKRKLANYRAKGTMNITFKDNAELITYFPNDSFTKRVGKDTIAYARSEEIHDINEAIEVEKSKEDYHHSELLIRFQPQFIDTLEIFDLSISEEIRALQKEYGFKVMRYQYERGTLIGKGDYKDGQYDSERPIYSKKRVLKEVIEPTKSDKYPVYNQQVDNEIVGQANVEAGTVLIDAVKQRPDTLPHEYAHHYIAWFRDAPIVQEAIKKWGSEEALVQSIGEQAVKQKGEAWDWWKKFVNWVLDSLQLSKLDKQELTNLLTDAFLTRRDLKSGPTTVDTKKNIQNNLLDLHLEAISQEPIYNNIITPLTFDGLSNLAKKYEQTNEDENGQPFISNLIVNRRYAESRNAAVGIGVKSLDSVLAGLVLNKNIYIRKVVEDRLERDTINFKLEDGRVAKASVVGGVNGRTVDGKKTVLSVISQYQNANLDNPEVLGKINSNDFTYDAERAIIMVGYDERYAVGITAQPIIRELAEARARNASSTNPQGYRKDEEIVSNIIEDWTAKYIKKHGKEPPSVGKRRYAPMSLKDMEGAILRDEFTEYVQLVAIEKFLQAERHGKQIKKLQELTNFDSGGIGLNLMETYVNAKKADRIEHATNLANAVDLFEDTIPGFIKEQALEFTIEKVLRSRNVRLFPYLDPVVQDVFKQLAFATGRGSDMEDFSTDQRRVIFNFMKSFVFADKAVQAITDGSIEDIRKRLLLKTANNEPLAEILLDYKEDTTNSFVNALIVDVQPNSKRPSIISYPASAGENVDEGNIYQDFIELITNPKVIKKVDQTLYTTRDLAKDLVLYSLVTGNIQKANEFVKYIPIPYLEELGVNDALRNYVFNTQQWGFNSLGAGYYSQVVTQFIQHYPELVLDRLTWDDINEQFDILEASAHGAPIKFKTKEEYIDKEGVKDFVIVYDWRQPKKHAIYAKYKTNDDGTNEYTNLSVLGSRFFVEAIPGLPIDGFAQSVLLPNRGIVHGDELIPEGDLSDEQKTVRSMFLRYLERSRKGEPETSEPVAVRNEDELRERAERSPTAEDLNYYDDMADAFGGMAQDDLTDERAQNFDNTKVPPRPSDIDSDAFGGSEQQDFSIANPVRDSVIHRKYGDTIKDALKKIARSKSKGRSTLAKYLAKFDLSNVVFEFGELGPGIFGSRSERNGKQVVTINYNVLERRDADKVIERTVLHEVTHVLTNQIIDDYREGKLTSVAARQTVTHLDNLRKKVISKLDNQEEWKQYEALVKKVQASNSMWDLTEDERTFLRENKTKYYHLTSLKEFVAGVLTEEEFQYKYKNMKLDNASTKNVLQRLYELIADLFNAIVPFGSDNTVLKDAFALSIDLIEQSGIQYDIDVRNGSSINYSIADSDADYRAFISHIRKRIDALHQARIRERGNNVRVAFYDSKIEELENQLAEAREERATGNVLNMYDRDMAEVERMLAKRNYTTHDYNYVKNILDMWENATDFIVEEPDRSDRTLPIFEQISTLNQIRQQYTKDNTKLGAKLLEDVSGKHSNTKMMVADILAPQKDTNTIASWMMDSARVGNQLLTLAQRMIRNASHDTNQEVIDKQSELEQIDKDFRKTEFFANDGYMSMAQIGEDGKPNGNLIGKEKAAYANTRVDLRNRLKGNSANDRTTYYTWLRDNHIYVDLNEIYEEDQEGYLVYKENRDYLQRLKLQLEREGLPEKITDLLLEQKKKVDEYNDRLEGEIRRTQEDPNATIAVAQWKAAHSPFVSLRQVNEGTRVSQRVGGEYIRNRGYIYNVSVSRSMWRDPKYTAIQNNPAAKAYYDYIINTLEHLYSYLPPKFLRKLGRYDFANVIPEIPKSVIEAFNEKGFRGATTDLNDWFKSLITDSTTERERKENELGIKGVPTGLDPAHKSYDLTRVMNIFTMSALAYKHKSKVADHVNIIQTIVHDTQALVTNGEGDPLYDKHGSLITKDPKNLITMIDNTVDSFYGKSKKVQGKTGWKIKTSEQKELEDELTSLLKKRRTEEEDERIIEIQERLRIIEREVTLSAVGNQFLQYIQMKGMGWNVFTAINNVAFGLTSNLVWAAGKEEFNTSQMLSASKIMFNVFTGNNVSKKIQTLMRRYDTVKEVNEASYTSTFRNPNRKSRIYMPYELHRKGELFVQGQTMVSLMLNTKIKDKNGNEHTLWDAYDVDGKLKENFRTEENLKDWQTIGEGTNVESKRFKNKLDQTLKAIHGNYDSTNSSVAMKQGILGRATLQFRSWVAEGTANRFEGRHYDDLLGRDKVGRYRTWGKFLKSLVTDFKRLAAGEVFDNVEKANMRKNMVELYLFITLAGAYHLLKALELDDEDEKFAQNFAANQLLRIRSDIEFYVSPITFEHITRNIVPAISVIVDGANFLDAVGKAMRGENEIETGPYAGELRTTRYGAKIFPGFTQYYRTRAAGERLF